MEQIGAALIQLLLFLLFAPLLQGIIKKTKARLQNRIGPGIFQPYYDLLKYLKKEAVISQHASWLTRVTPYLAFALTLAAGLLVPAFMVNPPLAIAGDVLLVVYLLGMVRFFTALAALDAGSSFGGMGSSREMALSAAAEPALLLSVFAVLVSARTTHLGGVVEHLLESGWNWLDPSFDLAFLAMLIVAITETGRIPVDNPDTHLELTMVHEGMLLEYSGRYLGLMTWAAQIKQMLILTLFVNLFFPSGLADNWTSLFSALPIYLLKLTGMGILLALIETFYAKIRLFKVPKLLWSSMVLSFLAILVRVI